MNSVSAADVEKALGEADQNGDGNDPAIVKLRDLFLVSSAYDSIVGEELGEKYTETFTSDIVRRGAAEGVFDADEGRAARRGGTDPRRRRYRNRIGRGREFASSSRDTPEEPVQRAQALRRRRHGDRDRISRREQTRCDEATLQRQRAPFRLRRKGNRGQRSALRSRFRKGLLRQGQIRGG